VRKSYDLVVVGGGVVGASLAYHAVAGGARTLLVDRADPGQASAAGAGIISADTSTRGPAERQSLARAARGYYPDLIDALGGGTVTGFEVCGMIVVAYGEEEVGRFDRHVARLNEQAVDSESSAEYEELDAQAGRAMFPALATPDRVLHHPHGARIDGRRLRDALLDAAERGGLERKESSARTLRVEAGRVVAVAVEDGEVACDSVAVAGGAWSREHEASLGVKIAVAPQRGQILHFGLAGQKTGSWPVVGTLGDYYLVAWPDGRVVCGATRESGTGFDPRPTAAGVREVLDEALRLAPGLGDATLLEIRVGLRPLSADLMPVLGRVPGVDNAFVATGHGPSGLALGPYSGKCVAELIVNGSSPFDLTPFRVDRPGLATSSQ
jgi:D-amino-acid dehydrogenase